MKTKPCSLEELNGRIWYRVIKVLFFSSGVLFFTTVAFTLSTVKFSQFKSYDYDNVSIQCNYGSRAGNLSAKDVGLKFTSKDFVKGVFSNTLRNAEITDACGISQLPTGQVASGNSLIDRANELGLMPEREVEIGKIMASFKQSPAYCIVNKSCFFISIPTHPISIILSIVIALVLTLTIFEGIRRISYYILFGKFFPKKFIGSLLNTKS